MKEREHSTEAYIFIGIAILALIIIFFTAGLKFFPEEKPKKEIVKEVNSEISLNLEKREDSFQKIVIENNSNLTLNISEVRTSQTGKVLLPMTYKGCNEKFVFHSRCI